MMSSFGFRPSLQTGLSKALLQDYKTELLCMRHFSLKCVKEFSVDTGLYYNRASLCKAENFKEFWKVYVSEIRDVLHECLH